MVVTIILLIQTLRCVLKDLKYKNLSSVGVRLKHVVSVELVVIKIQQGVVETMSSYKNELINLIYLHAILVFLGICAWMLLAKRKNSFTENMFLCEMILKKRKGKMFLAEESFTIESIVIEFFAEIGG